MKNILFLNNYWGQSLSLTVVLLCSQYQDIGPFVTFEIGKLAKYKWKLCVGLSVKVDTNFQAVGIFANCKRQCHFLVILVNDRRLTIADQFSTIKSQSPNAEGVPCSHAHVNFPKYAKFAVGLFGVGASNTICKPHPEEMYQRN